MNQIPQMASVTQIQKQPAEVFAMLDKGPVVLASYSKPAAVLVSVTEWQRVADELQRYREIAAAKRIAERTDAAGAWTPGEEMRRIMAERGVNVGD